MHVYFIFTLIVLTTCFTKFPSSISHHIIHVIAAAVTTFVSFMVCTLENFVPNSVFLRLLGWIHGVLFVISYQSLPLHQVIFIPSDFISKFLSMPLQLTLVQLGASLFCNHLVLLLRDINILRLAHFNRIELTHDSIPFPLALRELLQLLAASPPPSIRTTFRS